MARVTISSAFTVEIPKVVCEHAGLVPGQEVYVLGYGCRIELVPARTAREMRGALRGLDVSVQREKCDRF